MYYTSPVPNHWVWQRGVIHVGSKSMIQWKWWSCLMSTDNGPVLVFNNVSGWILVTNWGSLCEMYLVNLVYGSRVAFVRRVFCVTWHSVTPGCLWCGGVVKGWWWWLGTSRKKIIIFMPTLMLGMLLGTAKTPNHILCVVATGGWVIRHGVVSFQNIFRQV